LKRYLVLAILVITVLTVGMAMSCTTSPTSSAPPASSTAPAPASSTAPASTTVPATSTAPASSTAPAPSASPTAVKAINIRFAIAPPPGDELAVNAEEFAAAINQRTNGRYKVTVYAGESMIKLPETYDAVRTGAVEMTNIGMGIFEGMAPGLAELPMTVNNIRANAAAAKPFMELCSREILEKKLNMKALACYTTGGQELWSTKPIKTLDDWKGLLCGSSNPESAAIITGLGGASVPMSWTDFYTGLQKKTIDACLNSIRGSIVFAIPDVSKYLTVFYAQGTYNAFHINLDVWKKMTPEDQKIFQEEAQVAADKMIAYQIKANDETNIDIITKAGVNVYYLPKEERAKWKAALDPYVSKRLADLGDFGVQEKAILDKANADNP
jgi:TRAP-type C4-dicarboxylate transport system substrate-binding protein